MRLSNVHPLDGPARSKTAAVIPSPLAPERFPRHPFHPIGGVPMVVRVLKRAMTARGVDIVLVATDDARIARAAGDAGGGALMTAPALAPPRGPRPRLGARLRHRRG